MAYNWMVGEMEKRLKVARPNSSAYPVWAWYGSGAWGVSIWVSDIKLKTNINDSIEGAQCLIRL